MDSISSSLVDSYYKDDDELKQKRRITAIVGASYLLHKKASDPARLSPKEEALLEELLAELGVPGEEALELLREIEEKGPGDLLERLGRDRGDA